MDDHKSQRLVMGQHVTEEKKLLARNMRRNMTEAEAALWARARGGGLGTHFRRQQNLAGFIADFYCHAANLVVEIDGPVHNAAYDGERDRIFAGLGLATLRFKNEEVLRGMEGVLEEIRKHLPPELRSDPSRDGKGKSLG